jgi:hypothetical protein
MVLSIHTFDSATMFTLRCAALPCQAFPYQTPPLQVLLDLVVLNLTLLSTLSRSVLPSLIILNATLAGFVLTDNARLDVAGHRTLRCPAWPFQVKFHSCERCLT